MKLKEIMDLKVGEWFFHRGKPAKVVWTEFSTELVYLKDPNHKLNVFGICFQLRETGEVITLRSLHPDPTFLELEDCQK